VNDQLRDVNVALHVGRSRTLHRNNDICCKLSLSANVSSVLANQLVVHVEVHNDSPYNLNKWTFLLSTQQRPTLGEADLNSSFSFPMDSLLKGSVWTIDIPIPSRSFHPIILRSFICFHFPSFHLSLPKELSLSAKPSNLHAACIPLDTKQFDIIDLLQLEHFPSEPSLLMKNNLGGSVLAKKHPLFLRKHKYTMASQQVESKLFLGPPLCSKVASSNSIYSLFCDGKSINDGMEGALSSTDKSISLRIMKSQSSDTQVYEILTRSECALQPLLRAALLRRILYGYFKYESKWQQQDSHYDLDYNVFAKQSQELIQIQKQVQQLKKSLEDYFGENEKQNMSTQTLPHILTQCIELYLKTRNSINSEFLY